MGEPNADSQRMMTEEPFEELEDVPELTTETTMTGQVALTPQHLEEQRKAEAVFKVVIGAPPVAHTPSTAGTSSLSGTDVLENKARDVPPILPLVERNAQFLQELEKEDCFHGILPLEDVINLLTVRGDYLLRLLERKDDEISPCLTIRAEKAVDFPVYRIMAGKQIQYTVDSKDSRPTVTELIKHHHEKPISGLTLVRPITRQLWELKANRIAKVKKLGEGQFGEVWSGTMERNGRKVHVAVKITKLGQKTRAHCDEMFKESRMMRNLKHINIVTFYGMVINPDSVYIVMELVKDGGLDTYLKRHKDKVTMENKASFCFDCAFGLYYMHSKGYIHRDVACRNCLIDVSKNIVKLSDFGLSKQMECYKMSRSDLVPIRWQAPEVLRLRLCDKATDVYSFAMLVYEILNDGKVPFDGFTTKEIKTKIQDPNFRPANTSLVEAAPIEVIAAMRCGWKHDPTQRPRMRDITHVLLKFVQHELPNPDAEKKLTAKSKLNKGPSAQTPTKAKSKSREPAVPSRVGPPIATTPSSKLSARSKEQKSVMSRIAPPTASTPSNKHSMRSKPSVVKSVMTPPPAASSKKKKKK